MKVAVMATMDTARAVHAAAAPDDARLSSSSEEDVPDKRGRLNTVLKIVAESPPAKNAQEANDLVENAFNKVEDSLEVSGGERMFVLNLRNYNKLCFGNKIVHYEPYNRYTLFIGENGSIDVRSRDGTAFTVELLEKDPLFIKENIELFFEKAGADGRKVWD